VEGGSPLSTIKVILVEDDPMVQEIHRQYFEKVEGVTIIATASHGLDGLKLIKEYRPDLAIIDIYMPHLSGLELLKQLRVEEIPIDVVAITAASDIETVHCALQRGAFDYIMKPFTFDRIKKSLENYKLYKTKLNENKAFLQEELDQLLFMDSTSKPARETESLPKGLNMNTLIKVIEYIKQEKSPVSSEEVAEGIGMARITARRYLDFLEKEGKVEIHIQYGGVGRPINRYGLKSEDSKPV
jgi:two-component system, CitB family, response regulator DctR